MSGQSTDAENSKPVPSVSRPGDDNKSSSLGDLQSIASNKKAFATKKADQTFQKVPAGI